MRLTRRSFLKWSGAAFAVTATAGIGAQRRELDLWFVDIHGHLPLKRYGGPLGGQYARLKSSENPEDARVGRAIDGDSFEDVAKVRLAEMDALGIEQSTLLPVDFSFHSRADFITEKNTGMGEVARKYPKRFIPFMTCDLRRPDAIERLERAAREHGARGVKIHPLVGFDADDRDVCYPFYKKCAELGLPILGHCRPIGLGPRDDHSRPERYGRIARDFPDLKVCLGHFGGGEWTADATKVVEEYDNAYADVSTMQSLFLEAPEKYGEVLRRVMDGPARTRMMYGTDWPTDREHDAAFAALIRDGIPSNSNHPWLDQDEVRLFARENAQGFLGLDT